MQEGGGAEPGGGARVPAAAQQSHGAGLLLRHGLEEGGPAAEAGRQPGGGQGQPAEEPAAHRHVPGRSTLALLSVAHLVLETVRCTILKVHLLNCMSGI